MTSNPADNHHHHQSTAFAFGLLKELYASGENLVVSPYSLLSALGMVLVGADGATRAQLVETLFDAQQGATLSDEGVAEALSLGEQQQQQQLKIANILYSDSSFPLKPTFIATLKARFHALAKELSFSQANAQALATINSDVAAATAGLIVNFLQAIDPATKLILVNAIYFNGKWSKPFEKDLTMLDGKFQVSGASSGRTVPCALMTQKDKFKYYEDGKTHAKAIALDYTLPGIQAVFILPPEGVAIRDFIQGQLSPAYFARLYARMTSNVEVRLVLPRFKLSQQFSLVPTLVKLGIKEPFESRANLSRMSPQWKDLLVSEVIQKAVIEINEEGTEAAAATAAIMLCCAAPGAPSRKLEFIADRPFLYALVAVNYEGRDKLNILFMGVVEDPSKE